MKHGWHTKHFLGGWKTLKTQPALLLIAPVASIIGLGALIDSILYAFSFLFAAHSIAPVLTTTANQVLPPNVIGPTLVSILSNTPLMIITLLVVFFAILCQTAMIHVTHQHSKKRKRVTLKAAFKNATDQWLPMFMIHLTSFSAVFLLVVDMSFALKLFTGPNAAWVIIPVFIIDAFLMLYVLTIKMLALQFVAGDNKKFIESVYQAWRVTWRSPALVIEHNLILFVINAVAMTVLVFAIQVLSWITTAIGTWAFVLLGSRVVGGVLEITIFVIGALLVAGILTGYNFATWSHFANNIDKKYLPPAIKRFAKTYLPL